jgi:SAM-dependent methyltransferase
MPVKKEYLTDNSKEVFLSTWPGGYTENWAVYGEMSGKSEEDVVAKCLSPFFSREKIVLEVGCGKGFWTEKYLAANFKKVIALDLLPSVNFKSSNIHYIEVPDRDFSCFGVEDESIDFCWSFGVFCHLSIEACQEYMEAIFRKLKPGGCVSLYFSNSERRPKDCSFSPEVIQWVKNDFATTETMMTIAGFKTIRDLMPDLKDTMVYGEKSDRN